ncbi:MAG: deoxyguanosinetriphosphate triphosphohydrolase [Gammaproteobacteria bacterium]|nr:MAG: deoxyguanosinetriphosphate triphosphohydrolase [Gammaproteobacteria bacterium]
MTGFASSKETSRGRVFAEPSPSHRSEFQRDRDRIIHSAAFRRLEYKTQVFVNHEGDLFRTRLTHSIEVAQIARSAARALKLNEDLVEAISLAHDLGHTPFGHAGQDVLNECMREYGGFEHNFQSLRVVDLLEERYAEFPGLNLTFETREGILKHCSVKRAKSLAELGERFINGTQPGLEAQLTNVADEIAYNNHDIDDGLRYGLIEVEQLQELTLFADLYKEVDDKYPGLPLRRRVHEIIRRMINMMVVDLIENSSRLISDAGIKTVEDVRQQQAPLIVYSGRMREMTLDLKRFLREQLYNHYRVRRMTVKSTRVLSELFHAFLEDPRLMPPQYQQKIKERKASIHGAPVPRVVADYIAGMTDRYAVREYERLFSPQTPT